MFLSSSLQLCCTKDAIYQLSSLPFYSVCFHLLSQTEVEEALNESEAALKNPPPGMAESDVEYCQGLKLYQ